MLDRIKSTFCRIGRKTKFLASAMAVSAVAAITTIAASAEETATATADITSVITTAGNTLTQQFTTLVNTLVPVAIGIGVIGLGLYACIHLFKIAKKFFAQAAG